jgi:hypothetical protein
MKTKKAATDNVINAIPEIPEIHENEQIVIEDTKRIRREKMPITLEEPVTHSGPQDITIEPEDTANEPSFSPSSIASLIYDGDADDVANQFCTIHVRRKPDKMRDAFLTPCSTVLTLPAIQNVEITAERSDIEEIVRQQYGGGHYFFQVRFQNRLSRSWEASLADPPEAIAAARSTRRPSTTQDDIAAVNANNQPINPLDQFLDTLKKQRELQDLLFGEERRRLEAEIERLRQESQQQRPSAPQSDLALLLDAMQKSNNPGLIDFAREYLSGETTRDPQFGIWDFLKYVFDHKEEIAPLLASFIGGGQTPRSIEDVLRSQPPSVLADTAKPTLPTSTFRRSVKPRGQDSDHNSLKAEGDDA